MGPEALRVAHIEKRLTEMGYRVKDRRNLSGPLNPEEEPQGGFRHLKETLAWAKMTRDAVTGILKDGDLPIILGGDHSVSMGSISAVAHHCKQQKKPLMVFWLDAHTDFNTKHTTPTYNTHGMAVSMLCGVNNEELLSIGYETPVLQTDQVVFIGIRSVDPLELKLVRENGMAVFDMQTIDKHGMDYVMDGALEKAKKLKAHIHVSFDLDFLDPYVAPGVGTCVHGGVTFREARLCMERIYESGLFGSLDITELNPALDHKNKTAKIAATLVESLFGRKYPDQY